MGAQNIPAWQYSQLSALAYRDPDTLRVGEDIPPGWRYVETVPGRSNVQVAVFVNDAEGVVVGAERGTASFSPDMYPNNGIIAVGGIPPGGPPTEGILRDLGNRITH